VYGLVSPGQRIDEDAPYEKQIESRDFYAQTKILADQFAVSFARKNNLPLTILRPGVIYGPGKPPPAGLLAFRLGKTDFVFGNPAQRIPLNFSENLLDAMQLAASDRRGGLSIFNIVDDENLTLAQFHAERAQIEKSRVEFLPGWPVILSAPFAEAIGRAFPRANAGITPLQVKRALQDRWYNASHIRAILHWTPKVGLREALERSLAP
jgi:nucleoside-diphosphate-sugar epimerase